MAIDTLLTEFALDETGGAIVLQGTWGVGKTHFWRHRILPEVRKRKPLTRYSYVSLFGLNTLAELKTALAMATAEFDEENPVERASEVKKKAKRLFWRGASHTPDALAFVPTFGSQLAKAAERIGFYLVKDRLICIDDLERRGKSLDLRDVLGLASFLAEERNCRVLVILNEGHLPLDDQKTWHDYREKVFRGELTYAPTLEQSIEVGLTPFAQELWHGDIAGHLHSLGISNIRLIRRTADFMHRAVNALGQPTPSTSLVKHVAHVLTLLVYSVHGRGDSAPPLKRVMREFTAEDRVSRMNGQDNRSAEEKAWDDLIHRYGAHPHTPLDKALLCMVLQGYPDEEAIRAARTDFETNAQLYAQKDAWHAAFRNYHDTLQENGDEIVAAFERTWPPVAHVEHAHNMQFMAELLRLLGRSDLATRYINEWVDYRRRHCPEELEPRQLQRFTAITDSEILAASQAACDAHQTTLSLTQAWERLSDDQFDDTAIALFADAPVDDVVALLDSERREGLPKRIRHLLQLRGNPGNPIWVKASATVEAACVRIASRSPLAAHRVKSWFGIDGTG